MEQAISYFIKTTPSSQCHSLQKLHGASNILLYKNYTEQTISFVTLSKNLMGATILLRNEKDLLKSDENSSTIEFNLLEESKNIW